jgi:hypothetical protein
MISRGEMPCFRPQVVHLLQPTQSPIPQVLAARAAIVATDTFITDMITRRVLILPPRRATKGSAALRRALDENRARYAEPDLDLYELSARESRLRCTAITTKLRRNKDRRWDMAFTGVTWLEKCPSEMLFLYN